MTYAGVELGGTKCIAILADGPGQIVARESVPTTAPRETLNALGEILAGWHCDALGVASFGPIDIDPASPTYGRMRATPKPGWAHADILAPLADAARAPAQLDTDVNGAAFAEMRWGSGRGMQDFAYITVGTGIGVGLIVNGQPTRGFGHSELGHLRVARLAGDDWPGSCPFHGDCVEGLASGTALSARLGKGLADTPRDHTAWETVIWTLAQLCHAIVLTAAPRRIAIGGGVPARQPHLLERIEAKLVESLNGYVELPLARGYVCAPELGDDAGPLGAIALAMQAAA
ncbi:ROK family protein [Sphingomonas flavescens]|uniref:ROK family protein n=1 Tax=Sphingomonas flavescens TaxID=3132797 RepID=UPI002804E3E3|nr:ROK family protein [Sphingomonas limnosediminicola]